MSFFFFLYVALFHHQFSLSLHYQIGIYLPDFSSPTQLLAHSFISECTYRVHSALPRTSSILKMNIHLRFRPFDSSSIFPLLLSFFRDQAIFSIFPSDFFDGQSSDNLLAAPFRNIRHADNSLEYAWTVYLYPLPRDN